MDLSALKTFLKENNQPEFRLKQIIKAIYQDGISSFLDITTLPKDLQAKLDAEIKILPFAAEKVLAAGNKQSFKALLKLVDNNFIETVLISPKPGVWSACVSSQVGCAMNCGFCATGMSGFKRDLTSEEISCQVLFWRQYLRDNKISGRLTNIVYMGMGEPFLNWENVKESLLILTDANLFGFGSRSISVSTGGIPEGIEKIAEDFTQVNLAVSLPFADDIKRSEFMPINKKYNLSALKEAINNYFKKTNRKIFIEYALFDGINDGASDLKNLINYLSSFKQRKLLHVNIIPYNEVCERFKPSPKEKIRDFKNGLLAAGINATIRKSLGSEIKGACGQLGFE